MITSMFDLKAVKGDYIIACHSPQHFCILRYSAILATRTFIQFYKLSIQLKININPSNKRKLFFVYWNSDLLRENFNY